MKKENNSAELSQSDVKDNSDMPKSPSKNAPDYEILKAHYLEREEIEKEQMAKEDLLAVDSNELDSLKNVTSSNKPNRSWFSLDVIMTAGIVIGILAALSLVFLCIVWDRWYSIQLVMWVFLVLFVTADALFVAYFIQRNKFNEALEIFPKLLARKKELEMDEKVISSRQEMSNYEALKAHWHRKKEAEENLLVKKEEQETLKYLDTMLSLGKPKKDSYKLKNILVAVYCLLLLTPLPLMAYFEQTFGEGPVVLWICIIFLATLIALIIAYFIQKNRFSSATETYYERVALARQLKESAPMRISRINELEKQINEINDTLVNDIKKSCEIPFSGKKLDDDDYNFFINAAYEISILRGKIKDEHNPEMLKSLNMELTDRKLKLFYEVSIKGEASRDDAYRTFKVQLESAMERGDFNLLRLDSDDFENKYSKYISNLPTLLSTDAMSPLLDKLEKIKDIDTDNFLGLTSVDKLEKKMGKIKMVYNEAHSVYENFNKITEQINLILEYVRLCAYRNTYLGVEIINYIRINAGGGSITTSKDKLQQNAIIPDVIMSVVNEVDFMGNILSSFEVVGEWVLSSKESLEFSINNPKITLGAAAIGAVVDYIEARKEAIENLNMAIWEMIENISEMAEGYTSGKASISRATEIIKAIVKANKGFMQIYSPLREKVFEKGDISSVTKTDIQQIAKATNEYNKIALSKL